MAACCSSSRLAGRPCAALHQTTRTNAEVRHACQGAPHTLVPPRGGRSPLTCDPSLSAGPSVLDRVLESTSTKEKMAKYQAAVFKQCGAQPVSSYSAVAMDTRASRMMRPYLCVQPAEFPPSSSLSLCLCVAPQAGTPEAVALQPAAPADQKRPPAPHCNGEWLRTHSCQTEAHSAPQPDGFVSISGESGEQAKALRVSGREAGA